jgi:hypothetical protein
VVPVIDTTLLPACRNCNSNKASTQVQTWFEQQEFFTQVKMDRIKAWMSQEALDLFVHQVEHLRLAV